MMKMTKEYQESMRKLYENGKCNVTYFNKSVKYSQHLAKTRDLGVFDCEKEGKTVYYFIKHESIKNIMNILFDKKKER